MRADLRAGRICEIMVKLWGSRRSSACTAEDFVIYPEAKKREPQSADSMLAEAIAFAQSMGGTVSQEVLNGNAGRTGRQTDGE